jgi:hypothetical protein
MDVVVKGLSLAGSAVRAPQFLELSWSADPSLEVDYTIEELASEEQVAAAKLAHIVGPPETAAAPAWQPLAEIESSGSCGPFRFDRDEATYAYGEQLCVPGGGCKPMPGFVLGFLAPGPTVRLGY